MVGYFGQFLYLRMELAGCETFVDLLNRVGHEYRTALLHQDFGRMAARIPDPLAGLSFTWATWRVNEVFGEPTPAESTKLDIAVDTFPGSFLKAAENYVSIDEETSPGITSDHVTWFVDTGSAIAGTVTYRADVFDGTTIEYFIEGLMRMSERVSRNPYVR